MARISFRVWVLIIALILAALAISPGFESGVLVKSVEKNSSAFESGLRKGDVITAINNMQIRNFADYSTAIEKIFPTANNTKLTIGTKSAEIIVYTNISPSITVSDIPRTNIKTGLDLSGGARALVKPEKSLSISEMRDLIAVTSNRLNVYGISDVVVKSVSDLQGNNFMLVEVAGATPSDLRELVGKQGKFEAKIGNDTVFIGGEKDITSVCRNDASCARIESCGQTESGEFVCRFSFAVYLSEQAAKRHADITKNLKVNSSSQGRFLEKNLDLLLDDSLVDTLLISESLKGRVATEISIQGSGAGKNQQEAYTTATGSMKNLQTILITGSLPYKLEIVKLDSISPLLGKSFTKNLFLLGAMVFIIISLLIFIKYRNIKITLSVILTMFAEAFITLGVAAFIKWNLDAPSIAGIIAGMGTGVNDQIVIIDESVSSSTSNISERIKKALFIILGAFFTIVAAMLPLFWTGAGLLRGFALTTILSVSIGILITRPAFADILKKIVG